MMRLIDGRWMTTVMAILVSCQTVWAGGWIWGDREAIAPKNRFTYFRKVVDLNELPADATLLFAADSNARLWINGKAVRRKVARYHEEQITAEVVHAGPYLKKGKNVFVVLHHNWGDLITFQRTGNKHAGLFIDSRFVRTDASWRWLTAPSIVPQHKQVVGVIGDKRIRYAQIVDMQKALRGDIHAAGFDDGDWKTAYVVEKGPWPDKPEAVETPGQREYLVEPMSVLNAGSLKPAQGISDDPHSMAKGIRTAEYQPNEGAVRAAEGLLSGEPCAIEGRAGDSRYITFDFARPVHGYPVLRVTAAPADTVVDVGFCEIARALYDGKAHVKPDGWINTEGVVGPGYADRVITRAGAQAIELPDERTARWMSVHVHFRTDGKLVLNGVGIVKSQYPIEPVGTFQCGDERIDQIVKLCLIHAEVTMTDAYVDTPGREDGQWIEDDRPRAQLAASWLDDDRLRQLLIRTHAQGQWPTGNLHPFSPSNFPGKGMFQASYDWSVQWVAAIYDDYMWTGQTDRIERYWENIGKYWDNVLSHVDESGVWKAQHVLADIRVGVHPRQGQSSGIVTPWIIERLRWSAEMARAIGKQDQARAWDATADKMTQAFRKVHLVPALNGVPVHVADVYDPAKPDMTNRGYSQAGQTIAITAGLLTDKEALADVDYAFPAPAGSPPEGVTRWNNPTYGYRVLRTLSHVGRYERAVAHLKERYAPYLPGHPRNPTPSELQGPYGGPLPEYWVSREDLGLKPGEIDRAQPRDETGSHGWGAVPLLWMHDTVLGVTITKPGGCQIDIAPKPAGFPYVAGHTQTPKGLVWVYWDPQQWTLEVTIPDGVQAEVVMPPCCKGKRVRVLRKAGEVARRDPMSFTLNHGGTYAFGVR